MDKGEMMNCRRYALQLAMDYQRLDGSAGRDEKGLIETAKRFEHYLATGSNARDRTLAEEAVA